MDSFDQRGHNHEICEYNKKEEIIMLMFTFQFHYSGFIVQLNHRKVPTGIVFYRARETGVRVLGYCFKRMNQFQILYFQAWPY